MAKTIKHALVFIILLGCLSQAQPAFGEERRYALLVGIDQYRGGGITPLDGAVNDVRAIGKALVQYAGFPEDNIFYLTSDAAAEEERPTNGNIAFRLEWLADHLKSDDVLVFYFSGHALKEYLLTYNSDIRSQTTIATTALSLAQLQQIFQDIRASKVVKVMDACRSGPVRGKGDKDNLLTQEFVRGITVSPSGKSQAPVQVYASLFSCLLDQRAFEWPAKRRGFFPITWKKG